MNCKKKHEEALVRATQRWECGDITREILEYVFPETQESGDEKIKRAIIATIHLYYGEPLEDEAKEMISWLEKQGEKKHADKVEPKFKVGEWIVWLNKCYKVNYNDCGYELIDQMGLRTSLEYGTVDESAHLWTIEDAKDGDVLVSRSPFIYDKQCPYGGLNWYNNKFIKASNFIFTDSPVHPATKEQRDALMKAMIDAGYTFDLKNNKL